MKAPQRAERQAEGDDGICEEADWYSMSVSLHFECLVVGFVGCLTRGNCGRCNPDAICARPR